ncbi:MAG: hypothetical protein PUB51_02540 [Oscillospiraceae bacterium]|nr:hypothetical protein [Oscillospiraceae bacterium]
MLYLLIAAFLLYRWIFPKPSPNILNVYFGVPGSGKTTFAAYLAKQHMRESRIIRFARKHSGKLSSWLLNDTSFFRRAGAVYSNVPITGTYTLDPKTDIGNYMIENAKVLIDEAGIEYNNRNFKTFPKEAIYWYKYHRHYKCSVDVFSQSYEDMDVTLRRLAQNYFVVKKSFFPYFVVRKRIRRKIGIDDMTHQIMDKFYFGIPVLDTKWIFCPPLWKLFNSFSRKELPAKDWNIW